MEEQLVLYQETNKYHISLYTRWPYI